MMLLVQYKSKEKVTIEELNVAVQQHPFLGHFASTAVMQCGTTSPLQQLYLCLELINVIYPIFKRQAQGDA